MQSPFRRKPPGTLDRVREEKGRSRGSSACGSEECRRLLPQREVSPHSAHTHTHPQSHARTRVHASARAVHALSFSLWLALSPLHHTRGAMKINKYQHTYRWCSDSLCSFENETRPKVLTDTAGATGHGPEASHSRLTHCREARCGNIRRSENKVQKT